MLFWAGLYAVCTVLALAVTPGALEAMGFAFPVLLAAGAAAWLARRRSAPARLAIAVAAAAMLMAGAVGGTIGHDRALERQTASRALPSAAT